MNKCNKLKGKKVLYVKEDVNELVDKLKVDQWSISDIPSNATEEYFTRRPIMQIKACNILSFLFSTLNTLIMINITVAVKD